MILHYVRYDAMHQQRYSKFDLDFVENFAKLIAYPDENPKI